MTALMMTHRTRLRGNLFDGGFMLMLISHRHVAYIKSTPNPKSKANLDDVKGVGGVFMMLLEGIVVGVGALMCAIGSWFAHKFYKGEKLPFELLAPPSAAEEAAMLSGGKANVPITPDVAYTGKG